MQALAQSLLFNKVAGLRPATLLKKRLRNRCFPVNFSKFLRTPCKTPIYIIRMEIQANFSEAVNWRNIFPRNRWCYLTFSEHLFSQNTSVAASEFKVITIYSEIVISKCSSSHLLIESEICSKLLIKNSEERHWPVLVFWSVEHISRIAVVFLLLALNK